MVKYFQYVFCCCMVASFFFIGSVQASESVEKGKKVFLEYTLTIDGQEVESTKDSTPLMFEPGEQMLIPGFEKELFGMKVGEEKVITVAPEEAYGEVDQSLQREFDRAQFPAEIESMKGQVIDMQDEQGSLYPAVVFDVTTDHVVLDFNHPLAGKILIFDVKIASIENIENE